MVGRIAHEIGQREGLKAVLEGSIAPLGSHLLVVVSAVDCRTGATLVSEKEEPGSKEEVLKALDRLALRLRRRLGESLHSVQKYAGLPELTTSSLEALHTYDLGRTENNAGRRATAIPLFERAVELDPNFAEAYISLANIHGNEGRRDRAADNTAKAYALRDRVTERERYRVLVAYHSYVTGDLLKRIATAEMWRTTYPRDSLCRNNLAVAYGAPAGSRRRSRRLASLWPSIRVVLTATRSSRTARAVLADWQKPRLGGRKSDA